MTMSQPCDLSSIEMPCSAQYFLTASTKVRWLLSISNPVTGREGIRRSRQMCSRGNLLPDRRRFQQVNYARESPLRNRTEPHCKINRLPFRVLNCTPLHLDYLSDRRK